jgi:hypothetical protein
VVDGRVPQTPALAPNGHLLGYVLASTSWIGDHLDSEVWLADIDDAGASRRVTADTATESRPRWSVDSGTLFFLSDCAERGIPQAHSISPVSRATTRALPTIGRGITVIVDAHR